MVGIKLHALMLTGLQMYVHCHVAHCGHVHVALRAAAVHDLC